MAERPKEHAAAKSYWAPAAAEGEAPAAPNAARDKFALRRGLGGAVIGLDPTTSGLWQQPAHSH